MLPTTNPADETVLPLRELSARRWPSLIAQRSIGVTYVTAIRRNDGNHLRM